MMPGIGAALLIIFLAYVALYFAIPQGMLYGSVKRFRMHVKNEYQSRIPFHLARGAAGILILALALVPQAFPQTKDKHLSNRPVPIADMRKIDELGSQQIDSLLLKLTSHDYQESKEAILALADIAGPLTGMAMSRSYHEDKLISGIGSSDFYDATRTLMALGPRAIDPLLRVLEFKNTPMPGSFFADKRIFAVDALGWVGGPGVSDALIGA